MHEVIYDGIAIIAVIIILIALFQKRVRTSKTWRATVTPLASIIGSGFLVSIMVIAHNRSIKHRVLYFALYGALSVLMVMIIILGSPIE